MNIVISASLIIDTSEGKQAGDTTKREIFNYIYEATFMI